MIVGTLLELYNPGCRTETEKRRNRILKVKNFGVVVVSRIHFFQIRVVLKHVSFWLTPVIADKLACKTKPLAA